MTFIDRRAQSLRSRIDYMLYGTSLMLHVRSSLIRLHGTPRLCTNSSCRRLIETGDEGFLKLPFDYRACSAPPDTLFRLCSVFPDLQSRSSSSSLSTTASTSGFPINLPCQESSKTRTWRNRSDESRRNWTGIFKR